MNKRKQNRKFYLKLVAACSLLCCALLCGCVSGASKNGGTVGETSENGKKKVIATLFPYYDFARQIGAEYIDLTMVIPAGMDSHSFEPTPKDMITIQQADLVLCNGGEMEQWLTQVLEAAESDTRMVVRMMDFVDVYEEEVVEGMEDSGHHHADSELGDTEHRHEGSNHDDDEEEHHDEENYHEEEHDHEEHGDGHEEYHEEEHDHEEHDHAHDDDSLHIEYDEHIWTSPANAVRIVTEIAHALCELDPAHTEQYQARAASYKEELMQIDREIHEVVDASSNHTLVVADKFPFRYFAEEFGLKYYAAFTGCSADTEPSAKTIAFLIDKVKREKIPAVYYLELSSSRVAEILQEETGAQPLLLHSCHNVTRLEFDSGITYAELMRRNIEALKIGFSE
ncbi:MAG: metal ABC transporter substrate-binding protein [bacterium]|nr:metal ABC transporter substrate-binding protein [bacterium]